MAPVCYRISYAVERGTTSVHESQWQKLTQLISDVSRGGIHKNLMNQECKVPTIYYWLFLLLFAALPDFCAELGLE
jgi:hypothetical protein